MKQNPWTSPSVRLLEAQSTLARRAQDYSALDSAFRSLLALPVGNGAGKRPTSRRRLARARIELTLALDSIWSEGTAVLRRSIADSSGPVEPLGCASGLSAYVDLAEHSLGAFAVLFDDGNPGPPGAHFLHHFVPRSPLLATAPPLPLSPAHYDKATAWVHENFTLDIIQDMGIRAIQDLVRQLGPVKLTSLEAKRQHARRAARAACFVSGWKLSNNAHAVLTALARTGEPLMQKQMLTADKVHFSLRTLKSILRHLQVLDLVHKTPRQGFTITRYGLFRLRFTALRG